MLRCQICITCIVQFFVFYTITCRQKARVAKKAIQVYETVKNKHTWYQKSLEL